VDPHPVHYGALPVHPFAGTHKQQFRPLFFMAYWESVWYRPLWI
jgi:hypothetical protein